MQKVACFYLRFDIVDIVAEHVVFDVLGGLGQELVDVVEGVVITQVDNVLDDLVVSIDQVGTVSSHRLSRSSRSRWFVSRMINLLVAPVVEIVDDRVVPVVGLLDVLVVVDSLVDVL